MQCKGLTRREFIVGSTTIGMTGFFGTYPSEANANILGYIIRFLFGSYSKKVVKRSAQRALRRGFVPLSNSVTNSGLIIKSSLIGAPSLVSISTSAFTMTNSFQPDVIWVSGGDTNVNIGVAELSNNHISKNFSFSYKLKDQRGNVIYSDGGTSSVGAYESFQPSLVDINRVRRGNYEAVLEILHQASVKPVVFHQRVSMVDENEVMYEEV